MLPDAMRPDIDLVMEALNAWGDLRFARRLEGGYRNTVLLVEHDGERLVAKSTRRTPEAIAWVHDIHDVAEAVGIAVPRFVRSVSGQLVEGGVTVEHWLDGTPLVEADYEAAAQAVKRFHNATRGWPQRPGFASSQELLSQTQGGDVDLELMPPDLVRVCRDAWRTLAGEPLSAIHGDVNPSNMLRTPDGRIALLDWDEARCDVAAFDLVALAAGRPAAPDERPPHLMRAFEAWKAAVCWQLEPEHARTIARRLQP